MPYSRSCELGEVTACRSNSGLQLRIAVHTHIVHCHSVTSKDTHIKVKRRAEKAGTFFRRASVSSYT